jgi:murein DD-endopeptidase MepM/ murein hydrolase activator NlpD
MSVFCAVPPLDQAATRVGRGYGLGYNRARTAVDQLHGGTDFVADRGTPVVAPAPGVVALVGTDSGTGSVRSMRGYGNFVVLEHRFNVQGLPNPFWTGYMHLRDAPVLRVGQRIGTGDLLGPVGNTTNGQFSGMGAHLHFEVRRRPYPGSYERDTVDPDLLFAGMGIDRVGARREVQRLVGGQLLIRQSGPSDCRAGVTPTIAGPADFCPHGWMGGPCPVCSTGLGALGTVPAGYIDPSLLRTKYDKYGSSVTTKSIDDPSLAPPDYKTKLLEVGGDKAAGAAGGNGFALVAGAGIIGAALLLRRRST